MKSQHVLMVCRKRILYACSRRTRENNRCTAARGLRENLVSLEKSQLFSDFGSLSRVNTIGPHFSFVFGNIVSCDRSLYVSIANYTYKAAFSSKKIRQILLKKLFNLCFSAFISKCVRFFAQADA